MMVDVALEELVFGCSVAGAQVWRSQIASSARPGADLTVSSIKAWVAENPRQH